MIQIPRSWEFSPEKDGCTPESVRGFDELYEVFRWAAPTYTGRVTVPVLFDTATGTIVNEESADIAQMLATEFDQFQTTERDIYPVELRDSIDDAIDLIPVPDRGHVAAIITAVTYFAANAYPLDWSIDVFSQLLTVAMLPGVIALAGFLLAVELLGRVPYLGTLVQFLLVAVGLGAVLITYLGFRRFEPAQISG